MKKLNLRPEAVIFDMDGVIVDSMPYHFLAWYETLRRYGVRVSCFDVYSKEGERWDKSMTDFLMREGIRPTKAFMAKLFRERQLAFKNLFKPHLFLGARELIECLDEQGYRLALVTGTPHREVRRILPRDIRERFDCIVAGDDVKRGKPHPEPYRKAAALLGILPRSCLVVENAPYGVASAKKAGMFCAAVTTSLPRAYLSGADVVIERIEEVTGLIDSACSHDRRIKKRKCYV